MLKLRIITALVLLPIVLGAMFLLDRQGFAWVAGVFFVAGGWEWALLAGLKKMGLRLLWTTSLVITFVLYELFQPGWVLTWLPLFWVPALFAVLSYPASARFWKSSAVLSLLGYLLLLPSWAAVVHLQENGAFGLPGSWTLLFVLSWVWAADTGAYFSGRAFGKHKLAPAVSPGKTIEGLIGGVFLALALVFGVAQAGLLSVSSVWLLLLVTLLTVFASVLGDLFESMIKREAGMKDSGKLLPGHGGMLDRIDSVTAALPVLVAALSFASMQGGM